MPKDMPVDVKIEAVAGKPVELPSGDFVANAAMTRVGTDLHLTAPDGHTIVVEGYFAQQNPPDLVTHDGARLTSAMVSAFVPPEHAGQYAASGQTATDASPAGHITQEVGDAQIIHADGTKTAAVVGAPVYQGDVIQTSKTGAVNIQFADNTTFAISENARMSIDQFVYHSADHSGSSFFSMLQGVFVYTSGLIGKTNPADVSIETPVGSIGIRGTVVAGHIAPAGQQSQITIVDGAVTVTNGTGTQDLNTSMATVAVTGYQSQPEPVQMDTNTFNNSYHAIAPVIGDALTHFTGMTATAPTATAPTADHTAPATTAPAPAGNAAPATAAPAGTAPAPATHSSAPAPASDSTAPAPTGSAAPPPAATDSGTTQASTTAPATTAPPPTTAESPAAAAPPPPSTTFSNGTNTSSFNSGTTSFTAPPPSGSSGTAATAPPPPPPTTTTTTGTGTTTTTTAPPPPTPFAVHATDTTDGMVVAAGSTIHYFLTFSEQPAQTITAGLFSNRNSPINRYNRHSYYRCQWGHHLRCGGYTRSNTESWCNAANGRCGGSDSYRYKRQSAYQ